MAKLLNKEEKNCPQGYFASKGVPVKLSRNEGGSWVCEDGCGDFECEFGVLKLK